MNDSYSLNTPEQVDLALDVAGLGSRFIAMLIDTLVQAAVLGALIVSGFALAAGSRALSEVGLGTRAGRDALIILGIVVLLFFLIFWGYFLFFEMVWNGQTPGKRMMGIRVISVNGQPITFVQSLIRNLLRLVDMLPSSYMLGALSILITKRSQRLGDLAAGTLVVREHRATMPAVLGPPAPEQQLAPQVASAFSAEEIALARDFLLRSASLAPARRQELADQIASPLRGRLDDRQAAESSETILALVAAIPR